jgi:phosphoribosylamine--glycine ligase
VKILIVGGGAREHALAWKLNQDDPAAQIVAAPGNPGIASIGRCQSISPNDTSAVVAFARSERADLVVVGPEAPLAAGLVDALRAARIPAFGPTASAARIESSKSFAKTLLERANVPTARAERHRDLKSALAALRRTQAPVVVKASGLAAGKGAVVCLTIAEAERAARDMLGAHLFGSAGDEILIEEYMEGEELSLFGVTDGVRVLPMIPAQDHKRLLEGDRGPNTGGMGAYAPVSIGDDQLVKHAIERIFEPTLQALRDEGSPFTGLLYAGLMLTPQGPKVVEFNCRFGDPETEAILPLLDSSLLDVLLAVARGDGLGGTHFTWRPDHALTTVIAAAGYPDSPQRGDVIDLGDSGSGALVFHAGTAMTDDGNLITAGGRVFAVTGVGPSLDLARQASVDAASQIRFEGQQFRTDLGWRELQRTGAGASRN